MISLKIVFHSSNPLPTGNFDRFIYSACNFTCICTYIVAVKTLKVAEKRKFKSGGKKSEMAEKNYRTGRRPVSKHGHYVSECEAMEGIRLINHRHSAGYVSNKETENFITSQDRG